MFPKIAACAQASSHESTFRTTSGVDLYVDLLPHVNGWDVVQVVTDAVATPHGAYQCHIDDHPVRYGLVQASYASLDAYDAQSCET